MFDPDTLPAMTQCRMAADAPIAMHGGDDAQLAIVQAGWAAGWDSPGEGRRQIVRLYLPGDLCDPLWIAAKPSHAVSSLRGTRLVTCPAEAMRHACRRDAGLRQTLQADVAACATAAMRWLTVLGRKTPLERVAHLLADIYLRLRARSRSWGGQCEMLLDRHDIADCVGLAPSHVGRLVGDLRHAGVAVVREHRLEVLDLDRLCRLACVDAALWLGATARVDWLEAARLPLR